MNLEISRFFDYAQHILRAIHETEGYSNLFSPQSLDVKLLDVRTWEVDGKQWVTNKQAGDQHLIGAAVEFEKNTRIGE